MKVRHLFSYLLFAAASLTASIGHATVPAVFEATGEVFLKGSIDGKHMFLVLGAKPAAEAMGEIGLWAADLNDVVELGKSIYSTDHKSDLVGAVKEGALWSKALAPALFKLPWESLNETAPHIFKSGFEAAGEAYWSTKNPVLASLEYNGLAFWTVVEGASFLVIGVPVTEAGILLATLGAIPAHVMYQGLKIAFDAGKIAFHTTVGVVGATAVGAYSAITATTASLLTLAVAGGYEIFSGLEWALGAPMEYLYYADVETFQTKILISKEMDAVQVVSDAFHKDGAIVETESIHPYHSTLTLSDKSSGHEVPYATVNTYPSADKTTVSFVVRLRREYARLQKGDVKALTEVLAKRLKDILRASEFGPAMGDESIAVAAGGVGASK